MQREVIMSKHTATTDEFAQLLADATVLEHNLRHAARVHGASARPEELARLAHERAWQRAGLEDYYERLDALDRAERAERAA
jgi:hypothetical protein